MARDSAAAAAGRGAGAGRSGTSVLLAVTIGMGVLIVAGVAVLVTVIAGRLSAAHAPPVSVTLDEGDGARIAGVSAAGERVVVRVEGGGPDRLVILDARTGAVLARIALAR